MNMLFRFMGRRLVRAALCGAFFVSFPSAVGAEKPLADRVIADNGDMKNVLVWQWLNDLTRNNAAVALTSIGDLSQITLPRAWRRGQTVGHVVRSAELFLGRFRVHFEDRTLTLVSLTANEMMKQADYSRTVDIADWDGAGIDRIRTTLDFSFGSMIPTGSARLRQSMPGAGIGGTVGLAGDWLAVYGRLDAGGGDQDCAIDGTEQTVGVTRFNLVAGVRWLPFNSWLFSPFVQTALLYGVHAESYLAEHHTWGGPGFAAGLGVRIGPVGRFFLSLEVGRSILFVPEDTIEFTDVRAGVSYSL